MAVRNIAVTDTLETFRTEFNALAANDFGDIAGLSGSISATNLVDAMNETISIATSTAGFTIADDTSTTQIVGGGDTLTVLGTANQIQTVVSATDKLTLSFPNDITIPNDLTVTNNVTASGSTHTLGTIEISGNTLRSTDSTRINVNDTFRANTFETQTGLLSLDETSGFGRISTSRSDNIMVFSAIPAFQGTSLIFEGATPDAHETTLTVTEPTADRTITFPDITGTVVTTGDTGSVTSAMILNGTISTDDIDDDQISKEWKQFRCDAVSSLVKELKSIARNKDKKISAAVFPYPEMSREMVLQDWSLWDLDIICPMNYHHFYDGDIDWIADSVSKGIQYKKPDGIYLSGLFLGALSPSKLNEAIKSCLKSGADGVCLFNDECLTEKHINIIKSLKQ